MDYCLYLQTPALAPSVYTVGRDNVVSESDNGQLNLNMTRMDTTNSGSYGTNASKPATNLRPHHNLW